jgi:hypothetical protein
MRRFLLASVFALAIPIGAHADVIETPTGGSTGDLVTFQSLSGSTAVGSFNGQHTGIVDFIDLSGNAGFTGSANGNDIKIQNTSDLSVQVFNTAGTTVLDTSTQIFSLKGTGNITAFISANDKFGNPEAVKTFSLGAIDPNAQSFFTFSAINGESMSKMVLLDTTSGGNITDYEHYRIDVAAPAISGAPGPTMGGGLPGLAFAAIGMLVLNRQRQKRNQGLAV